MTEEQYLRAKAIVFARESGMTWAAIGKRHKISGSRAQQIYKQWTWPTDVAESMRRDLEERFELRPRAAVHMAELLEIGSVLSDCGCGTCEWIAAKPLQWQKELVASAPRENGATT